MRSLIYYANSLSQKIVVFLNRKKAHNGRIYMLHDVYATDEDMQEQEISMSLENFCTMIEKLQRDNRIVSLQELLNAKDEMLCAITFDDIFASAYLNAIPILQSKNIPYTCFIAPGLLGEKGIISESQLEDLSRDSLCTIGAHTMHHVELRKCNENEAYDEISGCKTILEEKTKREMKYFAFPYGSRTAVAGVHEGMAKRAGYLAAFSTFSMPLVFRYCEKHPFFIPRVNVNDKNWKLEIGKLL